MKNLFYIIVAVVVYLFFKNRTATNTNVPPQANQSGALTAQQKAQLALINQTAHPGSILTDPVTGVGLYVTNPIFKLPLLYEDVYHN